MSYILFVCLERIWHIPVDINAPWTLTGNVCTLPFPSPNTAIVVWIRIIELGGEVVGRCLEGRE